MSPVPGHGQKEPGPEDYVAWLGQPQEEDAEETSYALAHQSIDWIGADHYGIGAPWQDAVEALGTRTMIIDVLANRDHRCDLLLDQNYYVDSGERYASLVPSHCRMLLGPEYALLREEFAKAAETLRKRSGEIRSIMVFYGGYDRTNETAKALKAIQDLGRSDLAARVVVGAGNPHKNSIRALCAEMDGAEYLEQVGHIADLMAVSDLSLGGGGSTTWERCILGLPTVTTEVAPNQRKMLRDLSKQGAVWHLGASDQVTPALITEQLTKLMANSAEVRWAAENCHSLMGGLAKSPTHPVVEAMRELHKTRG